MAARAQSFTIASVLVCVVYLLSILCCSLVAQFLYTQHIHTLIQQNFCLSHTSIRHTIRRRHCAVPNRPNRPNRKNRSQRKKDRRFGCLWCELYAATTRASRDTHTTHTHIHTPTISAISFCFVRSTGHKHRQRHCLSPLWATPHNSLALALSFVSSNVAHQHRHA